MKVKNHRLFFDNDQQVEFVASPHRGGQLAPQYLVIHYTAAPTLDGSVSWFKDPKSEVSAHLLIGRDGRIVQMVPFNSEAFHAGPSTWNGLVGMNHHSIGIELENAGKLDPHGDKWRAWWGKEYESEEVLVAKHKHAIETDPAVGWHLYTEKQLEVAIDVSMALVNKYGLKDVLGHEDISPFRKVDPGPAFSMGSFRSKIMGRQADMPVIFKTTTTLNIRSGPGTEFSKLDEGPLPQGTEVDILRSTASWRFVDVLDELNGVSGLQGWVHGRFLLPQE